MSLAYGIANFTLLHTRMKLTGSMGSSASLFVMSLFLPKTPSSAAPYSMALSVLANKSWSVAFLLLFIPCKKGCSLMAS